jgi:hypothetical protein
MAQTEEATMAKRWFLSALTTLGLVGPAVAQMPPPIPMPGQGPPVYQAQFCGDPTQPPPAQFCGEGGPPPASGGGADMCCLPNDGSANAFNDECGCRDGYGFLVQVGGIGYQRQAMGNLALGFLDPGININGVQTFANTGLLPPAGTPAVLNTHDISPTMQIGVRAAVVWREPEWAVEVCGFYVPQNTVSHTLAAPAQIDLGFNFFPTPIGFTPGNGLWLQGDLASLRFQTTLWDGEVNYRWNTAKNFEFIFGVRYLDYSESLDLLTEQQILRTGVFDPNTTADISWAVHNRILAAQVGFETEQQLTERIAVGGYGKAGAGPNFVDYNHLLTRGDGFEGPGAHRSETQISQVYEISLYADFTITEQWRIRAGYQALWLVDLPLATGQISFDLNNAAAPFNKNGSVFYSGPVVEMQFVF